MKILCPETIYTNMPKASYEKKTVIKIVEVNLCINRRSDKKQIKLTNLLEGLATALMEMHA